MSLEILVKRGTDLSNPDSVKAVIASQPWSNATRSLMVASYNKFAGFNNISWTPPKIRVSAKIPNIPLEKDIDELIASCGKKTATLLQLLKETAMRIGEALRLDWNDVNLAKKTITLNDPEKNGTPRMFNISDKLVAMLNTLPRDSGNIFGTSWRFASNNFNAQRKRAAAKLGNEKLLKIHFHSLRHWKASQEYHRTKDILYVMKLLGHKNIANTLIYTHLLDSEEDDKYCTAVARNVEAAQNLISLGFEYVCTYGDVILFRKRK